MLRRLDVVMIVLFLLCICLALVGCRLPGDCLTCDAAGRSSLQDDLVGVYADHCLKVMFLFLNECLARFNCMPPYSTGDPPAT